MTLYQLHHLTPVMFPQRSDTQLQFGLHTFHHLTIPSVIISFNSKKTLDMVRNMCVLIIQQQPEGENKNILVDEYDKIHLSIERHRSQTAVSVETEASIGQIVSIAPGWEDLSFPYPPEEKLFRFYSQISAKHDAYNMVTRFIMSLSTNIVLLLFRSSIAPESSLAVFKLAEHIRYYNKYSRPVK